MSIFSSLVARYKQSVEEARLAQLASQGTNECQEEPGVFDGSTAKGADSSAIQAVVAGSTLLERSAVMKRGLNPRELPAEPRWRRWVRIGFCPWNDQDWGAKSNLFT